MPLSPLAIAGWFLRCLLAAILLAPAHAADVPPDPAAEANRIEAFVREGCPHCAKAEEFLAQLKNERPALSIVIRDVQKEPAALERLKELAQQTSTGPCWRRLSMASAAFRHCSVVGAVRSSTGNER